jgi:hypothetical protein
MSCGLFELCFVVRALLVREDAQAFLRRVQVDGQRRHRDGRYIDWDINVVLCVCKGSSVSAEELVQRMYFLLSANSNFSPVRRKTRVKVSNVTCAIAASRLPQKELLSRLPFLLEKSLQLISKRP